MTGLYAIVNFGGHLHGSNMTSHSNLAGDDPACNTLECGGHNGSLLISRALFSDLLSGAFLIANSWSTPNSGAPS